MKSEQLMMLALRVVAVIIAAYAFADVTNIVGLLLVGHNWISSRAIMMASLGKATAVLWSIPMIVALLLWWLAPRLSRLACHGTDRDLNLPGLDIERLTHAAFVVVGVWVLLFGVADLGRIVIAMLHAQLSTRLLPWGSFAEYSLRCLFGLVLIVGGRNLSRFLLHLRMAGTE